MGMSTITVRPVHAGVGGRATCPCGWTVTTTKRAAYEAAVTHNDTVHAGASNIAVSFTHQEGTS